MYVCMCVDDASPFGAATLATFIDARKAFDTVWRAGNYVRLHDLGVRGKMWRQLQAMNRDRQSKIRLLFGETEWFRIPRGVAQGKVESPCLYACKQKKQNFTCLQLFFVFVIIL